MKSLDKYYPIDDDLRSEAQILSMIAKYISQGRFIPNKKQEKLIRILVDEIYRGKETSEYEILDKENDEER